MEGILIRKACSIFQNENQWCALSLNVRGNSILKTDFFTADDFSELIDLLGDCPICVSFVDKSGYLTYLNFPFSGKRKIGMVVRDELEDYFPFPLDDVYFDFQEIGEGNVLVAAIPKTVVENFKFDENIKILTLSSIAALYGLRWFKIIIEKDFIFVNVEPDIASIMVFQEGLLCNVRQIVFSGHMDILRDAIQESSHGQNSRIGTCYLVCSQEDQAKIQNLISSKIDMKIESPALSKHLEGTNIPSYCWAGIGAALLSLQPKDEINILGERHQGLLPIEKITFYLGSSITIACIIITGLFYLNFYLKDKTYQSLNFDQMAIFRSVFPKSPPVKDVIKALEDRVSSLERDAAGSVIASGTSPLRLLSDISSKIDKQIDLKLSEFSVEGSEFVFAGTTVSFSSAEKIKKSLEDVGGVKSVEIQNIDLIANQVKFRMRGRF